MIAAVFIIGLQVAAILSHGTLSRMVFLESDTLVALVPEIDSLVWWPARAALGDLTALGVVLGVSLVLLGGAILIFSARFGDHAIAASSVAATGARQAQRSGFRRRFAARVLRQKEWTLLLRDPWLVSQTLMQILYLLPPALLLWRSYGEGTGALIVLVPVLVMAAGQLAGGLAWLAISGEDAPDLVATAPILARHIVRAKVEAVLGGIAIAFAPFIAALAFLSLYGALVSALGILAAAAAATWHPVLLPQAGDAALFPPPPDRLALCDLRGGVLVDLVGRDRGARDGRQLGGVLSGRDRRRHPDRGALDEPAQACNEKWPGFRPAISLNAFSGSPGHAALARGKPAMTLRVSSPPLRS